MRFARGKARNQSVRKLFSGPLVLACGFQVTTHQGFEFDKHLHVERRIVAPVARQRTVGPIGGGMLFGQRDAEVVFGDGGQTEAVQAEQSRRYFRVEQGLGFESDFGESGQVHQRIMQNPCSIAHGVIEFIPVSSGPCQGDGIKQGDARTFTFELNQPILMSIAESGRPFGVGGQRARRLGQRIAGTMIAIQRRSDIGHSPARLFQQSGFGVTDVTQLASSSSKRMVDLMNAAHERICAPASIVPSGPVPSSGVHETRISHPALVEPAIEPKAVFWVTVTVPDTESGSMPSK